VIAATVVRYCPDAPLDGLHVGPHPDPEPPEGWVPVRVVSASVNHHDLWTLRGVGVVDDRLPKVLGCDAAGVTPDGREVIVHAVVSSPGFGDETIAPDFSVLSERHDGTFAEWVAVPERNLVPKPEALSFDEAACLPVAYLTAYRMLFTAAGLRPGARVLVQGAGGGVSTAGIVLARAAGLHVSVTSRTAHKREFARELGAHEVYEPGARLSGRVDAVIETVGAATWGHSLRAVAAGGTVVVAGATTGFDPPAELQRLFYRQVKVTGSAMGTLDELVDLVRFLEVTGARPVIDSVLPLERAGEALGRMLAQELLGKIVLRCG
jgi:NADPH:quinone reductase-like Zn-dependent oxidoreductase